jgi:hypothetical protein
MTQQDSKTPVTFRVRARPPWRVRIRALVADCMAVSAFVVVLALLWWFQ